MLATGRAAAPPARRPGGPPARTAGPAATPGRSPTRLGTEVPDGFEVTPAVGLEGDQSAGVGHSRHLGDAPIDHRGELIVLTNADHGDDVGVAGHGVHLGDAVDLGQLDGQVGYTAPVVRR